MTRTKKDNQGRIWAYCDGDGTWTHGEHMIGCGGKNGSKWQIWQGPKSGHEEHRTLRDAMEACH